MHIITDIYEPTVEASPIGSKLFVKNLAAKYERGILANKIEAQLCANEIPDNFKAQK